MYFPTVAMFYNWYWIQMFIFWIYVCIYGLCSHYIKVPLFIVVIIIPFYCFEYLLYKNTHLFFNICWPQFSFIISIFFFFVTLNIFFLILCSIKWIFKGNSLVFFFFKNNFLLFVVIVHIFAYISVSVIIIYSWKKNLYKTTSLNWLLIIQYHQMVIEPENQKKQEKIIKIFFISFAKN